MHRQEMLNRAKINLLAVLLVLSPALGACGTNTSCPDASPGGGISASQKGTSHIEQNGCKITGELDQENFTTSSPFCDTDLVWKRPPYEGKVHLKIMQGTTASIGWSSDQKTNNEGVEAECKADGTLEIR